MGLCVLPRLEHKKRIGVLACAFLEYDQCIIIDLPSPHSLIALSLPSTSEVLLPQSSQSSSVRYEGCAIIDPRGSRWYAVIAVIAYCKVSLFLGLATRTKFQTSKTLYLSRTRFSDCENAGALNRLENLSILKISLFISDSFLGLSWPILKPYYYSSPRKKKNFSVFDYSND